MSSNNHLSVIDKTNTLEDINRQEKFENYIQQEYTNEKIREFLNMYSGQISFSLHSDYNRSAEKDFIPLTERDQLIKIGTMSIPFVLGGIASTPLAFIILASLFIGLLPCLDKKLKRNEMTQIINSSYKELKKIDPSYFHEAEKNLAKHIEVNEKIIIPEIQNLTNEANYKIEFYSEIIESAMEISDVLNLSPPSLSSNENLEQRQNTVLETNINNKSEWETRKTELEQLKANALTRIETLKIELQKESAQQESLEYLHLFEHLEATTSIDTYNNDERLVTHGQETEDVSNDLDTLREKQLVIADTEKALQELNNQ